MENNKIKQIFGIVGNACYSTRETQQHSFDMGKYINDDNIEGDVIECGVAMAGNFSSMMLGCLDSEHKTHRTFWGFDSFIGIQLAGKKDTVQAGIGEITHDVNVPEEQLLVSSGITVHPKQQVLDNLNNWELMNDEQLTINLVEGWVQNSIPTVIDSIEKISILRLDMDIYEPTIYTLKMLYPKMTKGSVIIIDDYALDGCRIALEEYLTENNINVEILGIENSTPKYFFKP